MGQGDGEATGIIMEIKLANGQGRRVIDVHMSVSQEA